MGRMELYFPFVSNLHKYVKHDGAKSNTIDVHMLQMG